MPGGYYKGEEAAARNQQIAAWVAEGKSLKYIAFRIELTVGYVRALCKTLGIDPEPVKIMMSRRKHQPAKVGDHFGDRTVIELKPADRTSNERVKWRCVCGREGVGYVFNLRRGPVCRHA